MLLSDLVETHALEAHDRWIVLAPDSTVPTLTDDRRTLSIAGVYGGFSDKIPMGAIMNKGLTIKTGQTHVHRFVPELLDFTCMGRALEPLLGEHDFAAFGRPMERTRAGTTLRGTTTRTLLAARCWAAQPCVYFYLEANAFLRHMVRLIVGTVLRVGQGRLVPSAVREILCARRLAASGPAVPARGLYLVAVSYQPSAVS